MAKDDDAIVGLLPVSTTLPRPTGGAADGTVARLIVTSALAATFPTVLAFIVDTPRCAASVHTFMLNMPYACSMLYRARLPMVVVLNKTVVVGCRFVKE